MATYFFDIDDGINLDRDHTGVELVDDQAARDEAARAMADIAKEYIPSAHPRRNITMWVRHEGDPALLTLSLSFAIQASR